MGQTKDTTTSTNLRPFHSIAGKRQGHINNNINTPHKVHNNWKLEKTFAGLKAHCQLVPSSKQTTN
ncbi:hypothetical protein HYC85_012580 [Camellia sinensis]|uniref:Uncharacterized protein n=1 Tax=Camellia sinensis TaxID=4442 RepID=A0A7J7HDI9_CAMSI|nr:hypothetical protein HYC85_012580 [Camellia sinensis]